jgi:hypothetical protein
LAIGGEDFPFCGAALAKILNFVIEKGGRLDDYNYQYEDEEDAFFSK